MRPAKRVQIIGGDIDQRFFAEEPFRYHPGYKIVESGPTDAVIHLDTFPATVTGNRMPSTVEIGKEFYRRLLAAVVYQAEGKKGPKPRDPLTQKFTTTGTPQG